MSVLSWRFAVLSPTQRAIKSSRNQQAPQIDHERNEPSKSHRLSEPSKSHQFNRWIWHSDWICQIEWVRTAVRDNKEHHNCSSLHLIYTDSTSHPNLSKTMSLHEPKSQLNLTNSMNHRNVTKENVLCSYAISSVCHSESWNSDPYTHCYRALFTRRFSTLPYFCFGKVTLKRLLFT